MTAVAADFSAAHRQESGPLLASTLIPIAPLDDPNRIRSFYNSYNTINPSASIEFGFLGPKAVQYPSESEGQAWVDVYIAYWKAIGEIQKGESANRSSNWPQIYDAWKEVSNALVRGYSNAGFQAWTVPCMYVVGRYLRIFAIRADADARDSGNNVKVNAGGFQDEIIGDFGKNERLEDAARQINRMFTLCINDRAPLEESRKWGLYYITNLLFKTYFKLNSIGLCKNILRAHSTLNKSNTEMPPIKYFPKSHIVTFKYYVGVILFLNEEYLEAEQNLTDALNLCHREAHRNKELILTYLIPCHLLTTHTLPSSTLLRPYPRLRNLFTPLSICIRRGNLAQFDAALAAGEDEFVKRRIYLTLERGRDIALRNLLRKFFITCGYTEGEGGETVRRSRIAIEEFVAAIRVGSGSEGDSIESDEVECLLANMITKNLMKGYISHEKGMVVLSKSGAFPGTNV